MIFFSRKSGNSDFYGKKFFLTAIQFLKTWSRQKFAWLFHGPPWPWAPGSQPQAGRCEPRWPLPVCVSVGLVSVLLSVPKTERIHLSSHGLWLSPLLCSERRPTSPLSCSPVCLLPMLWSPAGHVSTSIISVIIAALDMLISSSFSGHLLLLVSLIYIPGFLSVSLTISYWVSISAYSSHIFKTYLQVLLELLFILIYQLLSRSSHPVPWL